MAIASLCYGAIKTNSYYGVTKSKNITLELPRTDAIILSIVNPSRALSCFTPDNHYHYDIGGPVEVSLFRAQEENRRLLGSNNFIFIQPPIKS